MQSSVFFSLEKDTEEPPPLPFLFSPTWLDRFGSAVKRNKHKHSDKKIVLHLFVRT